MVVINVKYGQEDEFLYETTCDMTNDALIRALVEINNKRLQVAYLCGQARELGKYGPAKKPDDQGIDELKETHEGAVVDKGANYCCDPSGSRTGNGPGPQLAEVLEKVCVDAEAAVDKAQAKQRKALSLEVIDDKIANIRGAVTMAYPMGLPDWDPVKQALESPDGLLGTQASNALLEPDTATLWCAGREFRREQTVADRLGRNEKTKVVAKLQKPGAGAPAREPVVNEEERKSMMAHYFKKQEELKKLAEADDDDYLNSSWADPAALKRSLQGQTNIRAPGVRL